VLPIRHRRKEKPVSRASAMLLLRCCAVTIATSLVTDMMAQSSYRDRSKPRMKSTVPRMWHD